MSVQLGVAAILNCADLSAAGKTLHRFLDVRENVNPSLSFFAEQKSLAGLMLDIK